MSRIIYAASVLLICTGPAFSQDVIEQKTVESVPAQTVDSTTTTKSHHGLLGSGHSTSKTTSVQDTIDGPAVEQTKVKEKHGWFGLHRKTKVEQKEIAP